MSPVRELCDVESLAMSPVRELCDVESLATSPVREIGWDRKGTRRIDTVELGKIFYVSISAGFRSTESWPKA